jgi:hypothetical protein
MKDKPFISSAITTFERIAFFIKFLNGNTSQIHDYQFIQKKHTNFQSSVRDAIYQESDIRFSYFC